MAGRELVETAGQSSTSSGLERIEQPSDDDCYEKPNPTARSPWLQLGKNWSAGDLFPGDTYFDPAIARPVNERASSFKPLTGPP